MDSAEHERLITSHCSLIADSSFDRLRGAEKLLCQPAFARQTENLIV
jgi:hypothetical protein